MNIPLHPGHGVNAFLTYCPRCNGEGPDLLLVGSNDGVYECSFCHVMQVGKSRGGACAACGHESLGARVRSLKQGERLPGSLCEKCNAEAKAHAEIVAAGGVYWRCTNCKKGGVMKPNAYTQQVREDRKIPPPGPLGVEFGKETCPLCDKEAPVEAIKDADQVERGGIDGAPALPS